MLSASAFGTGAIVVALVGIIVFLARTWVVSKIQETVKEDVRWRALRRERAAAIADFLSVWVAGRYDPAQRDNLTLLEVQGATGNSRSGWTTTRSGR